MATWLAATSTVVAPIRVANWRSACGGIASSYWATKYHDGSDFQAGTPITSVNAEARERLLHGEHHARPRGLDVRCEVLDEVLFGEPSEATGIGEQIGEGGRDRPLREELADGLALVEAERRDVHEPDDVRRLVAERRHDWPP